VRCRIFGTKIGFDFHNASSERLASLFTNQNLSQQVRPDLSWIAVIKSTRERRKYFSFSDQS
jgi:hypothetical protein